MNFNISKVIQASIGIFLILFAGILFYNPKVKDLTILIPTEKPDTKNAYGEKVMRYVPGVYEALIEYSNNLNIESKVAVTWGKMNEQDGIGTWNFVVNKNKTFSDQSQVKSTDVVLSLAKNEISCEEDQNLVICKTNLDDDSFLRKVSLTPITKNGNPLGLGTGDYIITEDNPNSIHLKNTKDNKKSQNIKIIYETFQTEIERLLNENKVDLFFDFVDFEYSSENYETIESASLETFFIIPKPSNNKSILSKVENRSLVENIIVNALQETDVSKSVYFSGQFFSKNIVPNIQRNKIATTDSNTKISLNILSTEGLEDVITYTNSQEENKLILNGRKTSIQEIENSISKKFNEETLILTGWYFENANVDEFIKNIVIPSCASWIDLSEKETCLRLSEEFVTQRQDYSVEMRRNILSSLELFLLERRMIMPLFETKTSIIKKNNLKYTPHPLGDINLDNIEQKKLINF